MTFRGKVKNVQGTTETMLRKTMFSKEAHNKLKIVRTYVEMISII